jgi:hypothetical protein
MVGTRAVFEREKPINDVVSHDLLHVLERVVETERVFPGLRVKDSKDVTLGNGVLGCLRLCWGR